MSKSNFNFKINEIVKFKQLDDFAILQVVNRVEKGLTLSVEFKCIEVSDPPLTITGNYDFEFYPNLDISLFKVYQTAHIERWEWDIHIKKPLHYAYFAHLNDQVSVEPVTGNELTRILLKI